MPSATPAPASPAPDRRRWVAAAVLLVAVFAAYANTLHAPFVYDDTLAIPENPTIRRFWPLGDVLLPKVEGGVTVSGRPVLNLSFALNHAISGVSPWSYHVTNILIHGGAALLLFGLVRRTLARIGLAPAATGERLALAIAALWALHPLQTQAITYTVQRAESLMGFFYLLTLYGFVRGLDAGGEATTRRRWWAASVAACVLGVGTKEVMATAPLLVLLYDRTFAAGSFAGALRARRGYFAALFASWLVLAALLATTGGNRGGTVGLGVGLPLWAYPLTQFQALARYLGLSLWPSPLVFEYGTFWVKTAGDILPYAVVVLPLLAATVLALWRRPALGFLGVWFFLILAPTSLAPGTIQMIVEHRMYLPLAAVVTAVVLGVWRLAGARALGGFGAIALALAAATAARNHDYRSNLALWTDTVAKRPLNPRAHQGVAEALEATGRFDEAIKVRQESLRLLPDESHYHYNLALTLAGAGKIDEAVRHYRLALQLFPNEPRTHNNLAVLLVKQGRNAEALTHYAEAVRLRPGDAQYHYN
ncbi:MAG TPA: tetratricopeptide repeat protein, partial [Opitutaceae bacterium]